MRNPYDILGVKSDITEAELKRVYKKLCVKFHPDNGGDADKFAEITKAYRLITTGKARKPIQRGTVLHKTMFSYNVVM